jgi:1-acyl-sn-glycerol-3-phosphate acyltransferase
MMNFIRLLFSIFLIRPIILIVLGISGPYRNRLPSKGPAIIVAIHNSHLDTLVLMTLFPLKLLNRIRPVAAADYFLKNRFLAWFSLNIMNIVPIQRSGAKKMDELFADVHAALAQGDLVILYPEGSRGEPEKLQNYKTGIYHLTKGCPDVPIYPTFMHGLGKALPKGDFILVPFNIHVAIGDPFYWQPHKREFMNELNQSMVDLAEEGDFAPWD